MSKKPTTFQQQTATFQKEVESAIRAGFELAGHTIPEVATIDESSSVESLQTVANKLGLYSPDESPKASSYNSSGFSTDIGIVTNLFGQQYMMPTPVPNCGTPDKGYIPWGIGNTLPREIYRLAGALPYTASGLRYLTDLASGLGPRLMYKYTRYAGQQVTESLIPYESAGVLLRNLIRETRARIEEHRTDDPQPSSLNPQPDPHTYIIPSNSKSEGIKPSAYRTKSQAPVQEQPIDINAIGTDEDELRRLEDDYRIWEETMKEWRKFSEDNNLELHYQRCCMDDMHLDTYFPTIGLSQGVPGSWNPKIVKVGYLPAICTRFEEMDENLRINYVYYSEKWRIENKIDSVINKAIVAYPTLMPNERLSRLRQIVRENQRTALKSRPTWFCCPNYYPSGSRAYYQIPAWWSIFTSLVYSYASTLVTDKAFARKNATMWGKLIFINLNYLKAVADSLGYNTPEQVSDLKKQIVSSINDFLKRRENNGKTCALESMVGPDGKTLVDSVRIVDVPQVSNSSETKTELEEISSIIFFALGVHPALVGSIPGRSGSMGGTFQRELHLLKQNQMTPRQRNYLNWLNDIVKFNQWDSHATYVIEMPVLTTLDRSATGIDITNTSAT